QEHHRSGQGLSGASGPGCLQQGAKTARERSDLSAELRLDWNRRRCALVLVPACEVAGAGGQPGLTQATAAGSRETIRAANPAIATSPGSGAPDAAGCRAAGSAETTAVATSGRGSGPARGTTGRDG